MKEKALGNHRNKIGELRENIERIENEIEMNLREIEERLSFESVSLAVAERGREMLAEKVKPLMNEVGDTMKGTLNKVVDSLSRDPLPAFLIGIGAGLVILSLYSVRKSGRDGERLAFAHDAAEKLKETVRPGEQPGEQKSEPGSFKSIKLGLSALALGAAMSGFIPGVDSEKVEEWKSDLLAKAGEAGEEIIKGTEKMLRKKLSPESM